MNVKQGTLLTREGFDHGRPHCYPDISLPFVHAHRPRRLPFPCCLPAVHPDSRIAQIWTVIADIIGSAIFALDIAMNFHTGFVVRKGFRRALVMDKALIAKYYILHGTFLLDFLATVPIIPEVRTA